MELARQGLGDDGMDLQTGLDLNDVHFVSAAED
jgi:hypothetical protein